MHLLNNKSEVYVLSFKEFISVGIDVGSETSWGCLLKPDNTEIGKPIKIDHTDIISLRSFSESIKKATEADTTEARIFVESTGIYHIPLYHFLHDAGFKVYILNPLITDSTKNQGIRKVKSDKTDAKRIAKLGFDVDLKTSVVPTDEVYNLRMLARQYHSISDDITANVNQLLKELAIVFPTYSKVFSSVRGKTSLAILSTYRTPQDILNAPKNEIIDLIRKVGKRGMIDATNAYFKLVNAASLAAAFSYQSKASYAIISLKIEMIDTLMKQQEKLVETINETIRDLSDPKIAEQIELLETIPGVGFVTAVSLVAEIGDITAFSKPKHLVAFFGVDPAVKQSGKFVGQKTSMSKRGSRIARRVLFVIAAASVRKSKKGVENNPVLRAYYEKLLISKKKKVALGAIMKKIINIVFAVLRDHTPYKIRTPEQQVVQYQELKKLAA
jgi:transposase